MNNIKSYVLIFLCTFSVTTMANLSPDYSNPFAGMSEDAARYDVVATAFENAEAVEPEDVAGWRSGRCYHAKQPNKPRNTLLAVEQDTEGHYKTALVTSATSGQGHYDTLSPKHKERLLVIVAELQKESNPLVQESGDIADHSGNYQTSFRKGTVMASNEEHVIGKSVYTADPLFPTVVEYCYYLTENVKY